MKKGRKKKKQADIVGEGTVRERSHVRVKRGK